MRPKGPLVIDLNLHEIITKHGLLAVFMGTFLEGETVLVTAGILAGKGLLKPLSVWLSGSFGAWSGHVFWFFVGRMFGTRYLLPKSKRIEERIAEVNKIILERPKTAIFVLQYLYGMRIIGAMGLGITGLSFARFIFYEALNCMLWAAVVFMAGYIVGESIMHVFHGWLRWIWLGSSIAVLVLFFRHLELILLLEKGKN
jgi:membrane-associated protein